MINPILTDTGGGQPATFKESACLNGQGARELTEWEKCHAKYDRDAFSENLENKKACIYPRLTWEVNEMEQGLGNKYSTRITFTSNRTTYHAIPYTGSYAERLEQCPIS